VKAEIGALLGLTKPHTQFFGSRCDGTFRPLCATLAAALRRRRQ
jgi:hypothetical protein